MSRKRSAEREKRRQERAARRVHGDGGETPAVVAEVDSHADDAATESGEERSLNLGEVLRPAGTGERELAADIDDGGGEARVREVVSTEAATRFVATATRGAPRDRDTVRPSLAVAPVSPSSGIAVEHGERPRDREGERREPEDELQVPGAAVADEPERVVRPAATARRRRAPAAEPSEGGDPSRADDRIQRTVRLSRGVDAMIRALAQHRGIDLNAAISVAIAADFDRVFGPPPRPTDP